MYYVLSNYFLVCANLLGSFLEYERLLRLHTGVINTILSLNSFACTWTFKTKNKY